MVKQKVMFDLDRFNRFKDDIFVYEELMRDIVSVFSSVLSLGIHSGASITRLIRNIANDCIESENGTPLESPSVSIKPDTKPDTPSKGENNRVVRDSTDTGIEYIRFTSSGPVFQLSKGVLETLEGSYILEQYNDDCRTTDGSIYMDYTGSDALAYYLLDCVNGKQIDFSNHDYHDQLEFIDLFEFCGLPLPASLTVARERRSITSKQYVIGDDVHFLVNNQNAPLLCKYMKSNDLWDNYVMKYKNGFVDYNSDDDILYINKEYKYIDYIYQYIKNNIINIPKDSIQTIDKTLLESEMFDLFGEKGKSLVQEEISFKTRSFLNSNIIETKIMETPLIQWLGCEKKWKLLYRASDHDYSVQKFHELCDNKGETVTLVKHIGHNKCINIFGGYTDQSWDCESGFKPYSKEFLFTLSNEHGIPPTKYEYYASDKSYGIGCDKAIGPQIIGNDISIRDDCHRNNKSYCRGDCSAVFNTSQKYSLFVNTDKADVDNHFIVDDYEVWGIQQ
ncbi:hypothetical protein WA158_004759 [Blastocystis sp. Blastoise]